jgi:hypothetical protein
MFWSCRHVDQLAVHAAHVFEDAGLDAIDGLFQNKLTEPGPKAQCAPPHTSLVSLAKLTNVQVKR